MKLTNHSRNNLLETFSRWDVPKEFSDPMYNYLVHGYNPGGCFTSILANDFAGAIACSHPANTINAFKSLSGWMRDRMPKEAYGSYKAVDDWCYLKEDARRAVLENHRLVYSTKEEVWIVLKDTPTTEPHLY